MPAVDLVAKVMQDLQAIDWTQYEIDIRGQLPPTGPPGFVAGNQSRSSFIHRIRLGTNEEAGVETVLDVVDGKSILTITIKVEV